MCWLEPPVKCWIKIVIIDVSVNNCLVPDVRRKTFNLLPLSKMLPLSFSLSSFIRWEKSSSISYILKNFLIIRCSVQSLSRVQLFETPRITAHQASLSINNSRNSLKLMSIELVMPSSHLILCCPLLLLPPIPPSIRVFSNESTLRMRWPKYWSFNFSISPSNERPGLISFRMDWLDLLAVQGTLKSLLQHHSSKASILWHSVFFNCPALTFIHDYWKNHSFDDMELCWQSNVSAFQYAI